MKIYYKTIHKKCISSFNLSFLIIPIIILLFWIIQNFLDSKILINL